MKKLRLLLIVFSLLMLSAQASPAKAELRGYFFWGDGCPHCAKEASFLDSVSVQYPALEIIAYEVWHSRENAALLQAIGKELGADIRGVPVLVIGDQVFVGFSETMSPARIEARVNLCLEQGCPDSVAKIANLEEVGPTITAESAEPDPGSDGKEPAEEFDEGIPSQVVLPLPEINNEAAAAVELESSGDAMVNLPLVGQIDTTTFSLPLLTVIMGVLDGFNPCAMWALLFLISLLLGMKDRRRMWILGSAFIIASAAVYYVFMAAWLNIILFLGVIIWVRLAIGLLALGGGVYSLRDYFKNKEMVCEVGDLERKQRTMQRLKEVVSQNSFWLALLGIVGLAFMVNLVELICSAGLPAVYTQVLALNGLPTWQYYGYILLYIFFFMIDDLFVFFVAMATLKATGITTKYSRYSRLIGGVLMVLIGLLLILRPEWLMFG